MKERPILFSGAMVRAILAGEKTQTRRVVKPQLERLGWNEGWFYKGGYWSDPPGLCPYGQPGDRLWVRETWAEYDDSTLANKDRSEIWYRADDEKKYSNDGTWRPSIFMPRWASRITLELTGVRVERPQDISECDAIAEGTTPSIVGDDLEYLRYRAGYQTLWDSINAKTAPWSSNPWVWVIEFKRTAGESDS